MPAPGNKLDIELELELKSFSDPSLDCLPLGRGCGQPPSSFEPGDGGAGSGFSSSYTIGASVGGPCVLA